MYVISNQGELAGRYDKRFCSHSEITDWYSPGFSSLIFDIDGIRFGCAICIELSFGELFADYRQRGVHCMLVSSYSNDPADEVKARGHAAVHNFWVSLSRPTNPQSNFSALYGPDGSVVRHTAGNSPTFFVADMDLDDEHWKVPLVYARTWRDKALLRDIYEAQRVDDPRSDDKLSF